MASHIATLAGSVREGSLNAQLARLAAEAASNRGAQGSFVDLSLLRLPLYNADLEANTGIPENAMKIADRVRKADGLVIASPEYNGAYTALLKNVIDWVTRVDYSAWAIPTALMSATPGRSGGRRGLSVLRMTLENMSVPVVESEFNLSRAPSRLMEGILLSSDDRKKLDRVIDELLGSVVSKAA